MATVEYLNTDSLSSDENEFIPRGEIIGIPEERQGNVRGWGEMSYYLGQMFPNTNPGCLKFARSYFNRQKLFVDHPKKFEKEEERKKRIEEITRQFSRLERVPGYNDFEKENGFLLRVIDIAVKGSTNQDK